MAMADNPKTPMNDLIVILPGIMGSVLQKDGTDLWNVSGQAIWQVLKDLRGRLDELKLLQDDPTGGDLDDGIVATGLMQDTHLIPGLWKIDGYSEIAEVVTNNFNVTPGDIYKDSDDTPANFYQFPYDWRRYNSANANILKGLLDKRLQTWRNSKPERKAAKVILLAHSMGGLVSRYYLEVLGGWRDCKALFTFGTPYRGSLNAVNFLANGYKQLFLDLTDVVRSFNSIYELMPRYEILKIDRDYYRVAEAPVELPNINKARAKEALEFYQKIDRAIEVNRQEADYSYITVPIVGIEQKTFQSAILQAGKIEIVEDLPGIIANRVDLIGGDGTVPEISAFPPEFKSQQILLIRSVAEKHGALQNQDWILDDLQQNLERYQFDDSNVKGKARNAGKQVISLILEDVYFTDEPVVIKAQEIGRSASNKLTAEIFNLTTKETLERDFASTEKKVWQLNIDPLPAGLYRITVKAETSNNTPVTPVNDLFEVGNKSDY